MATAEEIEREKEARRLRELFRGRFSDAEARQILREKGTLEEAVDFVLSGDPREIRHFINARNRDLVRDLQRDGESVQQALIHGVETDIRLFACAPCDRFWWRKVPARKQVSKCKRCRVRYDPVPRECEWGLAEFQCNCGNTFRGQGHMDTQSPCFNCQSLTSPIRILPPTQPRTQRKNTPHSCTAPNCYNRTVAYDPIAPPDYGWGGGGGVGGGRGGRGRRGNRQQQAPTYAGAVADPGTSGTPRVDTYCVGNRAQVGQRGRGRGRGRGIIGEERRGGAERRGQATRREQIEGRREADRREENEGRREADRRRAEDEERRPLGLAEGAVGGSGMGASTARPVGRWRGGGRRGRERGYRPGGGAGTWERDLLAFGGAGPDLDEDLRGHADEDHRHDLFVDQGGHSHQVEDGDVCPHARSMRRKNVLHGSLPHVSTGSTVATFLSQGEIQEQYDDIMSMPSICEDDEASE